MSRPARRIVVSAVAGAVALTAAGFALYGPAASAGSLPAATPFYTDPNSQAARWVAANPNDSRAAAINSRIAQTPSGIWFANFTPSTVASSVRSPASSAGGKTPVLAIYQIPNRDCGGASAGGAPDISSYKGYIDNFASGLGSAPVVIILEPDSVALTTCLNSSTLADRNSGLSYAGAKLKSADPNAKVYLDAGHSAWNSASGAGQPAAPPPAYSTPTASSPTSPTSTRRQRGQLRQGGAGCAGQPGQPARRRRHRRNGNGPTATGATRPGRGLGVIPDGQHRRRAIDAFLWVKPPGEADGCADAAGTFVPDLAYALITEQPDPPEPHGHLGQPVAVAQQRLAVAVAQQRLAVAVQRVPVAVAVQCVPVAVAVGIQRVADADRRFGRLPGQLRQAVGVGGRLRGPGDRHQHRLDRHLRLDAAVQLPR